MQSQAVPSHSREYAMSLLVRKLTRRLMPLLVGLCTALPVMAATFPLPPEGSRLVGRTQVVVSQEADTLLDIARRFDIGYNEIVAANPGVDPWLPGEGTEVVVPLRFLLPPAPWEGIVVNLAEMRLYYFPPPGRDQARRVITHPIGIGREGWETPLGRFKVIEKIAGPSWTMPAEMAAALLAQGETPQRLIPPGPDNPLGDYAMQLDAPGILIHGTNRPYSIGLRVSHGCLRMYPEDLAVLFPQITRGTPVRIIDQAFKLSREPDGLYLEAHADDAAGNLTPLVTQWVALGGGRLSDAQWQSLLDEAKRANGLPQRVVAFAPAPAWHLQLGAFRNRQRAERLLARVQQAGLPSGLVACEEGGLCRVLLGPYPSKPSLWEMAARVKARLGIKALALRLVPPVMHQARVEAGVEADGVPRSQTAAAEIGTETEGVRN